MNEYINLNIDNIENEHICCAIGDKKHQDGVNLKKEWLKERIKEEYMYIYCLWVAGSFKGNGYGKELIEYAIQDSKNKGKNGICTITSKKKKPFLSEKKFFEKYGFKVVDSIGEYELLSLSFNDKEPQFSETARKMEVETKDFTIYYSPACPYTNNGIREIEEYAKEKNIPINIVKIDSLKKAKDVPCIFNNWANFKDGKFVSNTLLNKNSFEKLLK